MNDLVVNADAVEIAQALIAISSVNPRLASPGDSGAGESGMTAWLSEFCEAGGWPWAIQPVHPGRANFIALVPGGSSPAMLWEAHQDTVGVQGMTIPPLMGEVRDGRLHGRGACDVKGPMAAMLAALRRVSQAPKGDRPPILFAATVNEECGFTGARALADIWRQPASLTNSAPVIETSGGLTLAELQSHRPVAALVAEPTELDVVVAHRGVVRWRSVVRGRAAHSSRPDAGLNAVYAMADVVRAIDRYHREELFPRGADPQCGPSTVSVTTIAGGSGPNTVPDYAVIDVDRRLTPAEEPEAAYRELAAHLAVTVDLGGCTLEHEPPWMQSRGLESGANGAWAERVAAAVRSAGAASALKGVPYGTNAASIAAAGIPTVVFGPGSIDQAHTADEWIAVDQLHAAVDALERIAVLDMPANPHL
jgi:acetylornithine deacetylase/succinyl-diaminopimelate desuccinylase-like protein